MGKTWECPFYKWDARLAVYCEGGKITFPDRKALEDYSEKHCTSLNGWEMCSLAESLLQYYERKED